MTKIHKGDLIAESGKVYDFTEITGSLYVHDGVKDQFPALPALTTVGGYLVVHDGAKDQFPALTTVGGYLVVHDGAKAEFPALTTVGGYLDVYAGAKDQFPALTTVGGSLVVREGAKDQFPALTTVGGSLDVREGAKDQFPALTTVGGSLVVREGAKDQFPALTTVGGYLDVREGAKDQFPALTTVGGYLVVHDGAKAEFPALTTVGGYLDVYAGAKAEFPALKEKNAGEPAKEKCRIALNDSLAVRGLVTHDGILSRVVAKRGNVSRVVVVGQTKISYVVERDGQTAHGDTLQLARADLLFKLGKRDTSAFKAWKLTDTKPLDEMIVAYRVITGACASGVGHFMNGKKYGKKVSVDFVLLETKGQYGHADFAAFFGAGK